MFTTKRNHPRDDTAILEALAQKLGEFGTLHQGRAADLPWGYGPATGLEFQNFGVRYTAANLAATGTGISLDQTAWELRRAINIWIAKIVELDHCFSIKPEVTLQNSEYPNEQRITFWARMYHFPRPKGELIYDPDPNSTGS